MIGLTPRARELLVYLSERETCPTYWEMARALGYNSVGPIGALVAQLEQRGYIHLRAPHRGMLQRRRAIEVLKPAYPPVIINGERYRFIPVSAPAPLAGDCEPAVASVDPLFGQAAAGVNFRGEPNVASKPVAVPAPVVDPQAGAASVLGEVK